MSITTATVISGTPDYGTDVYLLTDLGPVWGTATGLVNLGLALARRLMTPRGTLPYDPNYGTDVRAYLNKRVTTVGVSALQGDISSECQKDERVQTCDGSVSFSKSTRSMFISATVTTIFGETFTLVMAATAISVSVLSVNGVNVQTVAPSLPPNTQLVVGPVGGQGPVGATGAAGASGTPQWTLDFDENDGESSTGAEVVVYQRYINFSALPATLTAELGGLIASTAGTATFKMYLGGTSNTADGTLVATITTGSNTPTPANDSTVGVTNPRGWQFVKITAQSSANGETASIYNRTATFR